MSTGTHADDESERRFDLGHRGHHPQQVGAVPELFSSR